MSERPPRLAVALNGYGLEPSEPTERWREVLSWEDLSGLAVLAEELGYEAIFTPEIAGWEAFTTLAGFASRTSRVQLVTGVVPMSERTPERLAIGAASLQELSGGRFTLGVGSRESIERTRGLLHELRELTGSGPGDWARDPRPVRLYLAALGPRMTVLAGEVADGVILNWCTPERVARAREQVSKRDGFTIAVYVRACLSHVDDQAMAALRLVATRYAAMEPYRRQFEAMGVDPGDADSVVGATCVAGDRDAALARLGEYASAGADVVVVYPVAASEAVTSLTGTLMATGPEP